MKANGLNGFSKSNSEQPKEETPAVTKTIDELAKEVIDGKWGNGAERKKALEAAGYDYGKVQAKVNELLSASTPTIKKGDKVKVTKAITYDGKKFIAWFPKYDVIEVKGNRAVIGIGKVVTAAINVANLKKA